MNTKILGSCWYDYQSWPSGFEGCALLYLHSLFDGLDRRIIDRLPEEKREEWESDWWRGEFYLIEEFGEWVSHVWIRNFRALHQAVVNAERDELEFILQHRAA